jgi:hypothetical protein
MKRALVVLVAAVVATVSAGLQAQSHPEFLGCGSRTSRLAAQIMKPQVQPLTANPFFSRDSRTRSRRSPWSSTAPSMTVPPVPQACLSS